ncbi:EAL domain-containing protein [Noviherbaspirillum sp. UKPF54]|uniref:bifunctional diguanylate cyclase/phosphodiesterase n=1 Tax=Noviherbaspirillum sp. UKPF54 TaxID=2601898 RepID=UPI0011B0FDCE|nr:EAL domain-containing protein [Noviherbaspirillum sp. UKPF54]QDZ27564.1 EAL domain-containing protein [Noviherbaspirillum sp. UKPF54]
MPPNHNLLLRQLKKLGIDSVEGPQSREQWLQFLDRVNRAYTEADQERYLMERSQEISSREMQELYTRLEEAQRIAGLGNWSFNHPDRHGHWSEECFRIFDFDPSSPLPTYRRILQKVRKKDRHQLTQAFRAARREGMDGEIEFGLRRANGGTRWVRALLQPVRNGDGTVARLHGTMMDITVRKHGEIRQALKHTITRTVAESASIDGIMPQIIQIVCETVGWACGTLWMLNHKENSCERIHTWTAPDPRVRQFLDEAPRMLGLPARDSLAGRVIETRQPVWIGDIGRAPIHTAAAAALDAGLRAAFAFPIRMGDELLAVAEFFSKRTQEADGEILQSAESIGRHISQVLQRRQAQHALHESEAHFRALVEQASDSFYVHDSAGRLIDVNRHACDSLGYSRDELLSMTMMEIDVDLSLADLRHLQASAVEGAALAVESRHRRKNGSTFPVEIRMGPIRIGGKEHLLSLVRDVTERKVLQEHIQHLAYHDALTALPNRAMFNRHLRHAIAQAQRYNKRLAVLFVDLDRFKNINDTLGHEAGDRLLQEMAHRIGSSLRSGDVVAHLGNAESLVARLGGDEFVVLVEEVTDSAQVSQIARRILAATVKEYLLDGQLVHMTASVGISLFPEDGRNEYALMKHADIAMYRAKDSGKNTFQFYSAQMDAHSAKLLALESGLRRAIERNELTLHYQPRVDANSGRITGVEALVRWHHPDLGLVAPAHFIPLAEETGLIVPLSKWVLRQACLQCCQWKQLGLPPLRVSVNLSARQFTDDNLSGETARTLREVGMDPSLLELEITESMMMYNTDRTIQVLSELRMMGIGIAIDDFGIGYSSLSHLKQFPIDIIKMDRSFIKDIPGDYSDAAIADAIIAMSQRLKVMVVAEGVETDAQLDFLRERGCDEIQGYYFSKPLPPDEFVRFALDNLAVPQRIKA